MNNIDFTKSKLAIANAKINFSIDVLERRHSDGMHEVKMILQEINIYDKLYFFMGKDADIVTGASKVDEYLSLASNTKRIPLDETNLVAKSVRALRDQYGIAEKMTIYIEKRIPSGGGLGGGSTDGARTITALNEILDIGLSNEQMENICAGLGSDMPFFVRGGAAIAEGTGTKLTTMEPMHTGCILLVNPGIFVSTKKVYEKIDTVDIPDEARPDIYRVVSALEQQNIKKVCKTMHNVLELAVFPEYPVIKEIRESLVTEGAKGALMSGSGSSVFGIFDDFEKAKSAEKVYRERDFYAKVIGL